MREHHQRQSYFYRCHDQTSHSLLCSLVTSTLAIPVVVFGAVSLIQQLHLGKVDKELRLKAIEKHNSFLTQDEDSVLLAHPAASPVQGDNGTSSLSASNQADPDSAVPAMLDKPERSEPTEQSSPDTGSADQTGESPDAPVPPQTAVLDRPERPEPDSAEQDATASQFSDVTTQQTEPQFSSIMSDSPVPARPYSPGTNEQVYNT